MVAKDRDAGDGDTGEGEGRLTGEGEGGLTGDAARVVTGATLATTHLLEALTEVPRHEPVHDGVDAAVRGKGEEGRESYGAKVRLCWVVLSCRAWCWVGLGSISLRLSQAGKRRVNSGKIMVKWVEVG